MIDRVCRERDQPQVHLIESRDRDFPPYAQTRARMSATTLLSMFPSVKPIHPCQGEKGREADEAKLPLEQVDSAVPVRENNNDDDIIPGTPSSTAGADPEPGGSENQPSRGADKAADKNDANDTEVENEDNDDNNTKTNALQAADSADAYKTPDLSRSSSAASPKQENKRRCRKRFLGPEKALLFACVSIFFIFFSHRVIHVLCRLNKRLASRVGYLTHSDHLCKV